VVIGSNAVVLGAITVGHNARIGSGAVVIKPVPADSTAVGVPAKVVRGPHIDKTPSIALQHAQLPDPIAEVYRVMDERIQEMEQEMAALRARVESVAREGAMAEAAAE